MVILSWQLALKPQGVNHETELEEVRDLESPATAVRYAKMLPVGCAMAVVAWLSQVGFDPLIFVIVLEIAIVYHIYRET